MVIDDIDRATEFCERCSAFYHLSEGRPGSRLTAEELLRIAPPGIDAADKHVLGIESSGCLVGVLDLIDGYPEKRAWYVGLFLIDPGSRSLGLGRRVWATVEHWIQGRGGSTIRLAVVTQNPRGRAFWESVGFHVEGRSTLVSGNRQNTLWKLIKSLATLQRSDDAG